MAVMNEPYDLSELTAGIQCAFTELEYLAPHEGPWSWEHPALLQWMQANNISGKKQLLDNPAAAYVVLQSLRAKIQKIKPEAEQLSLPITATPHWGAWISDWALDAGQS